MKMIRMDTSVTYVWIMSLDDSKRKTTMTHQSYIMTHNRALTKHY